MYISKKKTNPPNQQAGLGGPKPPLTLEARPRTPIIQLANLQRPIFSALTICEVDLCGRNQYDPEFAVLG